MGFIRNEEYLTRLRSSVCSRFSRAVVLGLFEIEAPSTIIFIGQGASEETEMTYNITPFPGQLTGLPQTPYRALGLMTPSWAAKRQVVRAGHATYYVAETQAIRDARADLAELEGLGWTVDVHPLGFDGTARITMHLPELLRAA